MKDSERKTIINVLNARKNRAITVLSEKRDKGVELLEAKQSGIKTGLTMEACLLDSSNVDLGIAVRRLIENDDYWTKTNLAKHLVPWQKLIAKQDAKRAFIQKQIDSLIAVTKDEVALIQRAYEDTVVALSFGEDAEIRKILAKFDKELKKYE
jgi:hypothetical protein